MKNVTSFSIFFLLFSLFIAPVFAQTESELKNDQLFIFDPTGNPMSGAIYGYNNFSVQEDFNFVSGKNGVLTAGDDLQNTTISKFGMNIQEFVVNPELRASYGLSGLNFTFTNDLGGIAPLFDQWDINMVTDIDDSNRKSLAITEFFGDDAIFIAPAIFLKASNFSDGVHVGLGTEEPKTKLHLNAGDVYLEGAAASVIFTSPNGSCFALNVDDVGSFFSNPIACPN